MDKQLDEHILRVVSEHQPITGPEIAAILNRHPVTVQRHCNDLQCSGRVTQVTGGMYVLENKQDLEARSHAD